MNAFQDLFVPVRINRLSLSNRIVFAPVATNLGDDAGHATEGLIDYYAARAKGGVGLIIVESCTVAPEGMATPRQIGIFDDLAVAGYRKLTDAVHRYDTRISLQLQHAGRSSVSPDEPVAPSPIPCPLVGRMPRELSHDDLERLLDQYGDATRRAREAGFDGVEVHLAHGYLLNEFLSPVTNKRTDEYGGSFENRLRFPLQVIQRVKEVAGGNLTVTSRISASEFLEGGLVVEDMKEVARAIVGAGIEAIHVSGGNYGAVEWVIQPCSIERGCFISMAGEIKKAVSVPIMVAGRINPEKALEALQTGKADLASLGRGLVADPDLPNKLKEGRREDVIPCISCNQGCIGRVLVGDTIRCLMNPRTGREKECAFSPAATKKNVVVVGGGPAGLAAAAAAARRGHQVTLYEDSQELGGQFRLAHLPPHKEVFKEGLDYLVREAMTSGATIVKGFRVDEKKVPSLEGEVAIVALGGEPIIPTIPGVTDEKVTLAESILTGRKKPGSKAAIIGGGLVGCEVASFMLKQYDTQVTIFEMLPDIAQDMMFINKITLLQYFSTKPNLKIVTSAKVSDLRGGAVTYEQEGKPIAGGCFDTIVIAVGYKSKNGVAQALEKQFSRVEIVGDCKKARKALEAIDEGFLAGSSV